MRFKTFALGSASLATMLIAAAPATAQTAPVGAGTSGTTPQPQAGQSNPAPTDTPAPGQTANSGDDNSATVVVTGIRRSLQSAKNIRRNSDQIVDAVVAEDIGKLPDLNTAQTAARIPGVQIYRRGGEADSVLVRGLPNFTTTYNGREIFTAETRVVALQDFPSANIAALEVFKTSSADLVEPGLAGLVNVRSRRPFDFTDGQFAGSVWGLYTRQGHGTKPNFNLLLTKRWDTPMGEFGVLLNGSYTDIKYLDAEISNTDFIADPVINGTRVRLPDIQRLFYRSGQRSRPSINAAVQWRPHQGLEFYSDFLWQGFANEIDDRLLEVPLYGGDSYSNIVLRPGTNLVSSGTVVEPSQRIFSFQGGTFNRTDTFQVAAGAKITANRLKLNFDVARTLSTFRGSTESIDRRWNGVATVNFNNETPSFGITGINFADPSSQVFQGLFEENQRSAGRDWQARADAQYDLDSAFLRNIQIGARYTHRNATRNYSNRYAFLLPLNIPATSLPLQFGNFRGYDFQPTFNWAAPTYDSIRENLTALRQLVINNCPAILPSDPNNGCRNYTIDPVQAALLYRAKEDTYAGYAQLNLGNDSFGGQIGVRVLRVKSAVNSGVPTGISVIDNGTTNTNVLPNASLKARIADGLQFRLAISKTVTRPNFVDLSPNPVVGRPIGGGTVGTQNDPYVVSGGNPYLKPFSSWNYDAAIEHYFGTSGLLTVSAFHRNLKGFIVGSSTRVTDPTLGVIQINGPVNSNKGKIDGIEVQGQAFADFGWLPDWARGFGVQGNVSYLKVRIGGQAVVDQTAGVSKWNYNLVGIYERYGFSARLSYNGRSSYIATSQNRGDDLYTETAHPAGRLDLSLNYDLSPRFTLFGDWTNITRKAFSQDLSSARAGAPRADYVRYLRYDESTVSAGVRFRFGK